MSIKPLSRRSFLAGSLSFGFVVSSGPLAAAANVSGLLRGDAVNWNGTVVDLDPLRKFYKGKLGKGIWTGRKGLNKRGLELVKVLQNSGADGLDAATYLSAIPKNVQEMKGDDLAAVELFLSQSFWKFGRDLSAGRTTPAVSEPDIIISRKSADVTGWLKLAHHIAIGVVTNDDIVFAAVNCCNQFIGE